MEIPAESLRGLHIYHLMTSALIPRPIAWTGTRSADGVDNLAPFSYFMGVSSKPPALAISVARAGRERLKDTARNILETRDFTVSLVSRAQLQDMVDTSARWPSEVSEFDATGLELIEGRHVAACWPAVAKVAMECRLIHQVDMGTTHLLVGEIIAFHIDETVQREGEDGNPLVDAQALDPVARLGGHDYTDLGTIAQALPPSLSR
jgi:flavin reductase (DIM6/NTAB) family NADH-FMN oxidoreductase RutF